MIASVACSGATFWPLKVIGLTVIVGVAWLARSIVPAVMTAVVAGLMDEAVMLPLLIVSTPPVVADVRGGEPPLLLKCQLC